MAVQSSDVTKNHLLDFLKAEKQEKRNMQLTAAIRAALSAYSGLKSVLGEQAARQLWEEIAKPKRGRPIGPKNAGNDQELLALYDRIIKHFPQQEYTPRIKKLLVAAIHDQFGSKYGASTDATLKKLNRLLASRNRELAQLTTEVASVNVV